jgi:PTS system nitrogen regulatory IIA component
MARLLRDGEHCPAEASDMVHDALDARERMASTALGGVIAITHVKLLGLQRTFATLGIHPSGIPYGAADGVPVRDILVVVVAATDSTSLHFQLLAHGARMLRNPGVFDPLCNAPDAAAAGSALARADGPFP